MTIGGAFLGGGVELVPAGSCKLVLEIRTEDGQNLATTFSVVGGGQTYTATAGADGRAELTVPSGVTYTVTTSATGYDGLTAQTVIGDSATAQYVRFEAVLPRVKKSGDAMSGSLQIIATTNKSYSVRNNNLDRSVVPSYPASGDSNVHTLIAIMDKNNAAQAYVQRSERAGGTFLSHVINQTANGALRNHQLNQVIAVDGSMYVTCPTPSNKTDNSTKVATTAWVNQSDFLVHTTGNETVAGIKSYTSPIVLNAWTGLHIKENAITKGSATQDRNINVFTGFYDKNDDGTNKTSNWLGGLRYTVPPHTTDAPPNTFVELSNQYYRDTYLRLYDNGTTAYATCPNPPSNATGNQIATANWSLGKFVQKSGDTMTGELAQWDSRIILKNSSLPDNSIPTETPTERTIVFSNAYSGTKMLGKVGYTQDLEGNGITTVHARKYDNTNTKAITVVSLAEGGGYATAPSWSVGTNSNDDKILTIKMANSLPSLVHTTGNETIAGQKTFSTAPILYCAEIFGATPFLDFHFNNDTGDRTVRLVNHADGEFGIYNRTIDKSKSLNLILSSTGQYATLSAPTPTNATSNEIATADWVLGKVPTKTTFSTWAELNALLVNGKPGDMMCITLDYVGNSNITDFKADDVSIHAFGNFTVEELTVSSGKLTKLEAFGGGEIQYNCIRDRYFAMTGFGQLAVGDLTAWALRVPYGGEMNLMLMTDNKVTSCTGFYVSL